MQLVHPGHRPVVGLLTVLIQGLDQRRTPLVQLARGVQLRLAGQLFLRARPLLKRQPLRGIQTEHTGNHFDVPQARPPGREDHGSGRQASR